MAHSESPRRTTTSAVVSSSSGPAPGRRAQDPDVGLRPDRRRRGDPARVRRGDRGWRVRREWCTEALVVGRRSAGGMRCRRCEQPPRVRERSGTGPGVRPRLRDDEADARRRSATLAQPGRDRRPQQRASVRRTSTGVTAVAMARATRPTRPGTRASSSSDHGEGQPGRDEQREHGDECRQRLVGAKVCSRLRRRSARRTTAHSHATTSTPALAKQDDRSADGRLMLFRDVCMRLTVERRAAARKRWVLGCGP